MFKKINFKSRLFLSLGICLGLLLSSLSFINAAVPGQINYQGRVTDENGNPFTGTGYFKFVIEDAGSSVKWDNDGGNDGSPVETSTTVVNGVFSITLGNTGHPNMVAIPAGIFDNNSELYLRVWFNDGSTGSEEVLPKQRLVSVGYSLKAENANCAYAVGGATITTNNIVNGAVTDDKITGPITNTKISGWNGTNWDTGYSERRQWDGGSTNLTPATGRTSLELGTLATLSSVGSSEITDNSITHDDLADDAASLSKVTNGAMVSSDGNIGIGITNPGSKLEIESSNYDDFIKLNRTGIGEMGISATNPRGIQTTDGNGNFIGWSVVQNSGYVGIGTTSPGTLLNVVGTGALGSTFQQKIQTSNYTLALGANSTAAEVQSQGGIPLYLNYGGNDVNVHNGVFVIKNDGTVGIGTTSPGSLLTLSSDGIRTLNFTGPTVSAAGSIMGSSSNGLDVGVTGAGPLTLKTNNAAAVTILSGGDVGIGTTSPADKLEIYGNGERLRFQAASEPSTYVTTMGIDYNWPKTFRIAVGTHDIIAAKYDGELYLQPDGGNVGIGTTSPEENLHVAGDILINNSETLFWKDSGGTKRGVLLMNGGNNVSILNEVGHVGVKTASPITDLEVNGCCKVGSLVDGSILCWTKPDETIQAIKNIKPETGSVNATGWGEVDHTSLPSEIQVPLKQNYFVSNITGQRMPKEFSPGPEDIMNYRVETEDVVCRDLTKTITLNTRALQVLIDKIETLEAEVAALKNK